MNKKEHLIWIDCEFTGIDYKNQTIIEIAVVITDKNLDQIAEPISYVIHQSDEVLNASSAWVKENIPQVLDESRMSTISLEVAEQKVLEYLETYTEKGISPMCGNSIGSDRHMLYYRMPKIEQWCHYRNIDVSTIKELAKHWNPEVTEIHTKKETHRALDDILESIEELKVYRKHLFK